MYKALLVDLDNTLLDFNKAEDRALTNTLLQYGLKDTKEIKEEFKTINVKYWNLFEKGEITKEELLVRRFKDFFEKYIQNPNAKEINSYYLNQLAESGDLVEHAYEMLDEIKNTVKIYPVTNGVYNTQVKRLERSGLNKFFEKVFVSEKIGYQKPKKEFFDYVFKNIPYKKEEVLLLGDSLTADIIGGIDYGIDTCWFNPNHLKSTLKYTFAIDDLLDVIELINKKN